MSTQERLSLHQRTADTGHQWGGLKLPPLHALLRNYMWQLFRWWLVTEQSNGLYSIGKLTDGNWAFICPVAVICCMTVCSYLFAGGHHNPTAHREEGRANPWVPVRTHPSHPSSICHNSGQDMETGSPSHCCYSNSTKERFHRSPASCL